MFPLSCARTHRSWHERTQETLSAHKFSIQKCLWHIFHMHHSKFRWVKVKCCTKEIIYAHTDFKRLEGTLLVIIYYIMTPVNKLCGCNLNLPIIHVWSMINWLNIKVRELCLILCALGYLKEENCHETAKVFMRECVHLAEYLSMLHQGREFSTEVAGLSLKMILDEYGNMKLSRS